MIKRLYIAKEKGNFELQTYTFTYNVNDKLTAITEKTFLSLKRLTSHLPPPVFTCQPNQGWKGHSYPTFIWQRNPLMLSWAEHPVGLPINTPRGTIEFGVGGTACGLASQSTLKERGRMREERVEGDVGRRGCWLWSLFCLWSARLTMGGGLDTSLSIKAGISFPVLRQGEVGREMESPWQLFVVWVLTVRTTSTCEQPQILSTPPRFTADHLFFTLWKSTGWANAVCFFFIAALLFSLL